MLKSKCTSRPCALNSLVLEFPKGFKNRKDLMNKLANSFVPLVLFWQICSQKFIAF